MAEIKSQIKGYRVQVTELTGGREVKIAEQEFRNGPQKDFLDHNLVPGNGWLARIRVRQNSDDGAFRVSAYENNQRTVIGVDPQQPAEWHRNDGRRFRIDVEQLAKDRWLDGPAIQFNPPKAQIQGRPDGWLVTFEPNQYPAVLTIAILNQGTAAKPAGSKSEDLPSFPFPTNPRHTAGSFLIPLNNAWGAVAGKPVRLGVRGAGLAFTTQLPGPNQVVDVKPEHFQVAGPAQPELLTDQYVGAKYQEKRALITYR